MDAALRSIHVHAYRIPTETSESDGTLEWSATTMVLCEVEAGGKTGLGWTYCDVSAALLIEQTLAPLLEGRDGMAIGARWDNMIRATRNLGRPGIVSCAVSAVDNALHDLRGKLLNAPLADLLGRRRDSVPVYGSGGFTSYDDRQLAEQAGGWAAEGLPAVKIKIGRDPADDPRRMRVAKEAMGDGCALFIDANGALSRKQATAMAEEAATLGATWFEEPVSSDDLEGLRLIRDAGPPGVEITAGEYGYDEVYFRRMCEGGAVDVLQADATRAAGITGFMEAAATAQAFGLPLSSHTAPALHLHACCAAPNLRHMEWFFDHVRVERMFFDGAPEPHAGHIAPDLSRPGLGLDFRRQDAERYRVWPKEGG
ncbi:enolase C-terminal domain-like protein [Tranquillimonas alkanivorans]|uniref:L-alanine-DL-glutamate epimerase n=1 Tax=Tranquillimonas alkanivorans TaxID=441119 RepID=A0A1I5VMF5_9RHOB|nr:enolase C-terminal domain-like protein [Tranquillimonas alkanivorans]SFQ08612.1 L-alanine-DL-glutamate epimerase [Tranquillimonas alkanivorans]